MTNLSPLAGPFPLPVDEGQPWDRHYEMCLACVDCGERFVRHYKADRVMPFARATQYIAGLVWHNPHKCK